MYLIYDPSNPFFCGSVAWLADLLVGLSLIISQGKLHFHAPVVALFEYIAYHHPDTVNLVLLSEVVVVGVGVKVGHLAHTVKLIPA